MADIYKKEGGSVDWIYMIQSTGEVIIKKKKNGKYLTKIKNNEF